MLTVKNRRAHRACHQNPRHLSLQLFIHRYKCRRVLPPKCTNARTAPVSNKAKRKDARRRPALPTPRLRRLSHLLGTEEDFCTKRPSEGSQDICRRLYVTENNSEGGHRTGEGNLLLCSTALTYLQDFFQVVKSKYEATGTETCVCLMTLTHDHLLVMGMNPLRGSNS
jgi:hypothetical protein